MKIIAFLTILISSCAPVAVAEKWNDDQCQESWCGAGTDLIADHYDIPVEKHNEQPHL